jgi:NAD(P)-dependent dehydrogenase (short-subunit alcohol dehydrogenase family)
VTAEGRHEHQVARVAAECADVSLLVNNAGVMRASTFTSAPDMDAARLEMETNYFGTLRMCRTFAPVLAAAGGGAIVNMLSITTS